MSSPQRDHEGHILPNDPHPHHGTHAARSWRRHRRVLIIAVPPLVVVAVWAILFAVYWGPSSSGPASASPPPNVPNLNPGNIPILSVTGALAAAGGDSGMVTFVGGTNLCPQCPVVPRTGANLNPPVVRFLFEFNLSDTGGTSQNVGGFGISISGGYGTDPFVLYQVLCCTPDFGETVGTIFMTAGQSIGFEAVVTAAAIASDAGSGYNMVFNATYSGV